METSPVESSGQVAETSPECKDKESPPDLDTGQGDESMASDDVERFTGKIVYNPDGSAYIIEGSEGSDVESEVGSILKEGSIVDIARPSQSSNHGNSSSAPTSPSGPIPQVVAAHHISRGSTTTLQNLYGALCASGQVAASQLQKVPEVPIMHSYRVFTLRDQNNSSDQSPASNSQVSPSASAPGDANNNRSCGDNDTDSATLTVPVKPILMCFICKISFGYAKSFVSHATTEHNLTLIDEEQRLLGHKNTSAIIQGVGKDKEPLLSFLEPKNKAPQPLIPSFLASGLGLTASNLTQPSSQASSVAASVAPPTSCAVSNPLNSNSGNASLHQQFQQQLMAMQVAALAAMRHSGSSSVPSSSILLNSLAGLPQPSDATTKESSSRPSSNGSLNLVMPKNSDDPEKDQDCSELADLANLEKIARAAAAALQQHQEVESQMSALIASSPSSSQSPNAAMMQMMNTSPKGSSGHPSQLMAANNSMTDGKSEVNETLVEPKFNAGHMTMMHSRNSCKTLKCPKCNWHYKYQETLEIHMKEKHPENEMNCIYCLTNQSHPRLARGETYTCGYKPYRCEVCNYSTTTKGNLSIHMQSDKHINNVQELQNGNIPAEHMLQSQALAVAAAAAASSVSGSKPPQTGPSSNPSGSNASSPGVTTPAEKVSPVSVPGGVPPPSTTPLSGSQGKPKATWRCDVCNYETGVARNLRIHMTSEKHTHNMVVLQQSVKQYQAFSAMQQHGLMAAMDPMLQMHPGLLAALASSGAGPSVPSLPPSENMPPEAAIADMAYNHAVLFMQQQQQRAMAMMQQNQGQGSQNKQPSPFGAQNSGQPMVDLDHPDPSFRFDSVPYDEGYRQYQCCVCTTFTCDTVEELSQHIQMDRTRLREDEVLMAVGGNYICKLCSYKTSLKANFQLHCKTDKHLQRLQQVNHIKEGGSRSEWKLKFVNVSNPIQVRCNLCDYYTNSIHKLQLHCTDPRHEAASRTFLVGDNKRPSHANDDQANHGNQGDNADSKSDTSSVDDRDDGNSMEQQAAKFLKLGGGVPLAAVSDRHVYKYRCQQCSLAFKTKEKLHIHSQYHLIRAATQCILCNRSFRSVEALQRHVEQSHRDMAEDEVEFYRQSMANNPLLAPGRNGPGVLDPATTEMLRKESNRNNDESEADDEAMDLAMNNLDSSIAEDGDESAHQESEGNNTLEDYLNSQAMAEDSYNDPSRKYKCHRCKVAFTRQPYLTSHNKTLLHRKGEKMSYPMEKYLDPNRPFKCDICKESFTQKNILLVHYNSVSHLHKLKQSTKDSATSGKSNSVGNEGQLTQSSLSPNSDANNAALLLPPSSSPGSNGPDSERKPYKCNICKVSYNLASTLDIHIRSVLHQTRASKINELIMSGQLDVSQLFIDRGETEAASSSANKPEPKASNQAKRDASPSPKNFGISMAEQQLQKQLQQQQIQAQLQQQIQQQQELEQQLQQQAVAALNSAAMVSGMASSSQGVSGTGVYPCVRCGAVFTTQETSLQHQQLCCLFGPNAASQFPMMADASSSAQRGAVTPGQTASDQLAALRAGQNSKYYSAPTCRSKPPIYKHLLETFGFEIVMQFNEHHQRRKKIKGDTEESMKKESEAPVDTEAAIATVGESELVSSAIEGDVPADESTANESKNEAVNEGKCIAEEKTNCDSDVNLPEINRSACDVCHKEFSSIWVLKAHREEVHKQVVPLALVESYAEEFRKDFEKKRENQRPASRAESSGTSGPELENSQNPNCEPRPTPSQTPGDLPAMAAAIVPPVSSGNGSSSGLTAAANNNNNGNSGNGANGTSSAPPENMQSAASQLAAQMQFSQLLMSMGLAGMGMPGMVNNPFAAAAAMGIPPQMIPALMMGPHLDPMMAAAFNHQAAQGLPTPGLSAPSSGSAPSPSPSMDPIFAAQQKLIQQQQLSAAQQQKRARTRITDDQLKILRQYFDINNSPTEEALQEMSEKSGLPLKVIKHWFRNTLFKERQRNKDSPYNFNNPPSTFLNLEEYEKTGETKLNTFDETSVTKAPIPPIDLKVNHVTDVMSNVDAAAFNSLEKRHKETPVPKTLATIKAGTNARVKAEEMSSDEDNMSKVMALMNNSNNSARNEHHEAARDATPHAAEPSQTVSGGQPQQQPQPGSLRDSFDYAKSFSMSPHSESSMSSISTNDTGSQHGGPERTAQSQAALFSGLPAFAASAGLPSSLGSNPLQMAIDAAQRSQAANNATATSQTSSRDHASPGSTSGSGPGKRANRTRFTDYQIKVLQEFFESNAYPKDDDLEYLSKLLNLSPRVIVVWFQNARQKARKVYENQPAAPEDDSSPGRFQRTPGLNYQCKKCMQVFQRYYELIKHQKSACFKDENPLSAHLRAAAENRQGSTSPGAVSTNASNSSTTPTPDKNANQAGASPSANAFRCEKCSLVFPRFDLWREHQLVHLMNPNLFPSYPPTSPFGILQFEGQNANNNTPNLPMSNPVLAGLVSTPTANTSTAANKRKLPQMEDEDSQESFSGLEGSQTGSTGNNDQPRDKRLRTTILPEQLDYLYQKYQIESNPSRKMLENIAKEVGLKKRVVQVWFQNTRARERKGQFRAHQQVIHKRCPFCRALFKARSALESHLATRHADQYTKGDINIDALPDGEPDEPQGADDAKALSEQAKQWKKYMEEFVSAVPTADGQIPPELALSMRAALGGRLPGEAAPLDLSKPVDLTRGLPFGKPFGEDNGYDSRSEDESGSESDGEGHLDDMSNPNSPAPGSTNSSITSPAAIGANGLPRNSTSSNSNKRFRTQMTTVQLKVMKSIFAEYKTPSMSECDSLGRDIGLAKRVIQVWFQNARAKEKKARLAYAKSFGHEMPESSRTVDGCKVCNVRYNLDSSSTSMQDHLFSKRHLDNLKSHIEVNKKSSENPEDSVDYPGASTIVMPGNNSLNNNNGPMSGDEAPSDTRVNASQSVNNLMQLMGLAFQGMENANHMPGSGGGNNAAMTTNNNSDQTISLNGGSKNAAMAATAAAFLPNFMTSYTDNSGYRQY